MLILVETAAGYALFELKDKGIMKEVDTIADHFNDAENANNWYLFFLLLIIKYFNLF